MLVGLPFSSPDEEPELIYYSAALRANQDVMQELNDAVNMLKKSITAIDHLSPKLECVFLQTGCKVFRSFILRNFVLTRPLARCMVVICKRIVISSRR